MRKLTIVLLSLILVLSVINVGLAATALTDISNHWAKTTIEWGADNGIVKGYPDNTFRPNDPVTEAEFLTLLIRTYEGEKDADGGHWADGYYQFAVEKNLPTNGADSIEKRNNKIDRTHVAEIIAGASGVNYTGDHAIQYLLGKGLAKGKVEGKINIENYKGADLLTRAEAIQFIKNAKESGLAELKERPFEPTPVDELPELPKTYTWNGYVLPVEDSPHLLIDTIGDGRGLELTIEIYVDVDGVERRFEQARAILASKLDKEFVDEVMAYAMKKQKREDSLEFKVFYSPDGRAVGVKDADLGVGIAVTEVGVKW